MTGPSQPAESPHDDATAELAPGHAEVSERTSGGPHHPAMFPAAVAAVVAVLVGLGVGWLLFSPQYPADDSPEAGFARDMTEHHNQAIEMSLIILGETESNDVRVLGTDILTIQGVQVGRMQGWLVEWDLPSARPTPERMTWMDHDVSDLPDGVPMPGMASPEEIAALQEAEGEEAEILYLQLMLTHHISGVEMADAAVQMAGEQDVLQMARNMGMGQVKEIDLIVDLLEARGAEPRESQAELDALREQAQDAGMHEGH